MKTIFKLAIVVLLLSFTACRDTKKEDQTIKATEEIESIEVETDSLVDNLKKEADEIEKELKELENLE